MTTTLDDRVRVLMARLAGATPLAPEFELLVDRPVAVVTTPAGPPRGWKPLVAAAAALAFMVAGIAIYVSRDTDTASITKPTTLQLATDLPDGWQLLKAVGPGTFTTEGFPPMFDMTVYATDRAPLGPVVGVTSGQHGLSGGDFTNTTPTKLADGRRASLSDVQGGTRWADVEVTPGTWVGIESRGIDDAALLLLAATITIGTDRSATFATEAAAAAGLSLAGSGSLPGVPVFYTPDSNASQLPNGMTASSYAVPTLSSEIEIATFMPTPFSRALLGLNVGLGDEGGTLVAETLRSTNRIGIYLERDGVAFYATVPPGAQDEFATLMDAMHPVSAAEWQRAVAHNPVEPVESTVPPVETTAAPSTQGPVTKTVEYTTTVTPSAATGVYELLLTGSDGSTLHFTARYAGPTITISSDPALGKVSTTDINVTRVSDDGSYSSSVNGSQPRFIDGEVSANSPAVRMVVVADGVRYVIDLVQPDPTYPVKFGVFMVTSDAPPRSARPDLPRQERQTHRRHVTPPESVAQVCPKQ
ncbi:MAG: hypothetical protein Q7V57_13565 [Actinomycetota bacterium]|nr:hypothetical protein [Actinomycetota bacterium]